MLLLIYFIVLLFAFNFRKPASPSLLLVSIYLGSLVGGILVGNDFEVGSSFKVFNLLFLAGMLTLLILPWNKFSYKLPISEPDPDKLRKLTNVLLVINGTAFFVFAIICYYSFSQITNYSAFKEGTDVVGFGESLPFNRLLYLAATYLHSTAYVLLPLHFYYLYKRRYVVSGLCLIFSLNIILNGLTIFSRSAFVVYLLLYVFNLPFFYGKLNRKMRNVVKATAGSLLCVAAIVFAQITANRFGNVVAYKNAAADSKVFVESPEVFSLLDYGSQWYRNSGEVMASYSFETLNGELSFPLIRLIADKLQLVDYPSEKVELTLSSIWGNYYDKFNGLIANLLFDFGYIGTTLFALLYLLALRKLQPVRGELSFTNLLMLGGMFVLPAAGIFNSELKTMTYNTLIIYSIIIYMYLNSKKVLKTAKVNSNHPSGTSTIGVPSLDPVAEQLLQSMD